MVLRFFRQQISQVFPNHIHEKFYHTEIYIRQKLACSIAGFVAYFGMRLIFNRIFYKSFFVFSIHYRIKTILTCSHLTVLLRIVLSVKQNFCSQMRLIPTDSNYSTYTYCLTKELLSVLVMLLKSLHIFL